MASAQWTPFAEAELDDILYFIGVERRRPLTAERLYYEIRDLVETHARLGRPGHTHQEMPGTWRYIRHKRWLIAYEVVGATLTVRRFVDASRDLRSQFEQDA